MQEHEISQRLTAAASQVSARPDLAEVEFGAGRVRARRRWATGVAAAMLVAGAGGAGFGLGQSVGGDDAGGLAAAPEASAPSSAPPSTLPIAPEPTSVVTTPNPDAVDTTSTNVPAPENGDGSWSPYTFPFTLVNERTLDDRYRLRVLRSDGFAYAEHDDGDGGWVGWQPPGFCRGSGELRITADGPDLVDVVGGVWYDEMWGPAQVTPADLGLADGHPLRAMVVQAGDVSEARITWADGAVDSAPFAGDVAILAVAGGGAYESDYTLELVGGSGTVTLTQDDLAYYSDPDYQQACTPPPPALPEAGEQPADPAAARAAFDERFALLWDRTVDDKPAGLIDDETGIGAATEAVFTGGFAEAATSATHTIEELVFTSPSEAWFRYGIDSSNGYFGQRYGFATLTDDGWTFPRALVCQDLSLAGGMCEPQPYQIFPPAWYEQSGGQQCIYDPVDGTESCATFDEVMASFG